MTKKIKDDQWHFRCNTEDKKEAKRLLKEINKPTDFILTFFIKEFNTASSRLQMEIENIDAERKEIDDQLMELQSRIEFLEERRNKAMDELNNTSLYDIANYKNNDAVIGAIGSIKDYVLQHKLTNYHAIPTTLFYEINTNFKVNDMELLKEISLNEFDKWQKELKTADDESDNAKMTKIYDGLLPTFRSQRYTNNWKDFLKSKDNFIKRRAETNGWSYDDLLTFLNNKKPEYDKWR